MSNFIEEFLISARPAFEKTSTGQQINLKMQVKKDGEQIETGRILHFDFLKANFDQVFDTLKEELRLFIEAK